MTVYQFGNLLVSIPAGGGYTYGDEDPAEVLSTATGSTAGSYVAPQTDEVLAVAGGGTAYGPASGTTGTLTIPAEADVQAGAAAYGVGGISETPSYPTTATTDAAHLAADKAYLNTHKDEMIAANTDIKARFDCDDGTAAGGGGGACPPIAGA